MERNIPKTEAVSSVSEDKTSLRKQMKQLRAALSSQERQEEELACRKHLRKSEIYQQSRWIYPYLSYNHEMDTLFLLSLLWKDGKRVAVPKVVGREMQFWEIGSLEDCAPGAYGILEPKECRCPVEEPGLMLLPGLAFDRKGGRLGYGGGFYDRYLRDHDEILTVVLAYECQIISAVPAEGHDRKVDYLLTREGLFAAEK